MGPSSLTDLPEEILKSISALTASISRVTLRNFALCSQKFHRLCLPDLYQHVDLFKREERWQEFQHLKPLAALLLDRPDLARLVHRLTLDGQLTEGDEYNDGEDDEDEETGPDGGSGDDQGSGEVNATGSVDESSQNVPVWKSPFEQAVARDSISSAERRKWLKHLRQKDQDDAVLGLLLPALPRLESLELVLTGGQYVQRILQRAAFKERPEPGLQHLQYITLSNMGEKYGMDLEIFCCLFSLPMIERIYTENMGR